MENDHSDELTITPHTVEDNNKTAMHFVRFRTRTRSKPTTACPECFAREFPEETLVGQFVPHWLPFMSGGF